MRKMLAAPADHFGLRAAMADFLLPLLVGAMSFLASLAVAGALAATALAVHWQGDNGIALTIQMSGPGDAAAVKNITRLAAVLGILQHTAGVSAIHVLSAAELDALLKPWLGADASDMALPVPAVISATWGQAGPPDALAAALGVAAPGTQVATGARWAAQVAALTASIEASAVAVLLIVALVAAAVVAVATRAGLGQGRDAIEIIHGLGALDADIADRLAQRATIFAAAGAAVGALISLPVLLWLNTLAAPFGGIVTANRVPGLPETFWAALPALPLAAAVIGWCTTQFTVRGWLRRLT